MSHKGFASYSEINEALLTEREQLIERIRELENAAIASVTKDQWIFQAYTALLAGVEIMTKEQLAQWHGVRAVLETVPADDDEPPAAIPNHP